MSPNKKTRIPIATAFSRVVYRTSILLRSTMGREMKMDSPMIAEKKSISGKLAITRPHPTVMTYGIFKSDTVNENH